MGKTIVKTLIITGIRAIKHGINANIMVVIIVHKPPRHDNISGKNKHGSPAPQKPFLILLLSMVFFSLNIFSLEPLDSNVVLLVLLTNVKLGFLR